MEGGVDGKHYETPYVRPWHRQSPSWNDPRTARLRLKPSPHRCRAFPLLLVQMGMIPSAACECNAEKQTVLFSNVQSIYLVMDCMA